MSNSRRNFLKATLTTAAAIPTLGIANSYFSNNPQSYEHIANEKLLQEFEMWVDHYVIEIRKEKEMSREFKDNRALVDLPTKMEEMMPIFKSRFHDQEFMKDYLKISRKLSLEINIDF